MKIAVVCASGRAGKLIVEEAISRGHEVTAVVRDPDKAPQATKVIVKDLFDLTFDDIKDCEVIIDAFGTWTPYSLSAQHLLNTSVIYSAASRIVYLLVAQEVYMLTLNIPFDSWIPKIFPMIQASCFKYGQSTRRAPQKK